MVPKNLHNHSDAHETVVKVFLAQAGAKPRRHQLIEVFQCKACSFKDVIHRFDFSAFLLINLNLLRQRRSDFQSRPSLPVCFHREYDLAVLDSCSQPGGSRGSRGNFDFEGWCYGPWLFPPSCLIFGALLHLSRDVTRLNIWQHRAQGGHNVRL